MLANIEEYKLRPPTAAGFAVWFCAVAGDPGHVVFASVAETAAAALYLLARQTGAGIAELKQHEAHAIASMKAAGHADHDAYSQLETRAAAYRSPRQRRAASAQHEFGITAGVRLAHVLAVDGMADPEVRREALGVARSAHPAIDRLQKQDPGKIKFPSVTEIRRALAGHYGDPSYFLAGFALGASACRDRAAAAAALRDTFTTIILPANAAAQELAC